MMNHNSALLFGGLLLLAYAVTLARLKTRLDQAEAGEPDRTRFIVQLDHLTDIWKINDLPITSRSGQRPWQEWELLFLRMTWLDTASVHRSIIKCLWPFYCKPGTVNGY